MEIVGIDPDGFDLEEKNLTRLFFEKQLNDAKKLRGICKSSQSGFKSLMSIIPCITQSKITLIGTFKSIIFLLIQTLTLVSPSVIYLSHSQDFQILVHREFVIKVCF